MTASLEKALNEYAKDNCITPEKAAEQILGSFLIAAGFLKRTVEDDERGCPQGNSSKDIQQEGKTTSLSLF